MFGFGFGKASSAVKPAELQLVTLPGIYRDEKAACDAAVEMISKPGALSKNCVYTIDAADCVVSFFWLAGWNINVLEPDGFYRKAVGRVSVN